MLVSGVVLVLLGVEVVLVPEAAGLLLSQPTVNANNPQRTSNVQIFFIALTFPKNCARNVLRRDRPAPSHYLKRPPEVNIFPLKRKNIENVALRHRLDPAAATVALRRTLVTLPLNGSGGS